MVLIIFRHKIQGVVIDKMWLPIVQLSPWMDETPKKTKNNIINVVSNYDVDCNNN